MVTEKADDTGVEFTSEEKKGLMKLIKGVMTGKEVYYLRKKEDDLINKTIMGLLGAFCPVEVEYTVILRGDPYLKLKLTIEETEPGGDIEIRSHSYRVL